MFQIFYHRGIKAYTVDASWELTSFSGNHQRAKNQVKKILALVMSQIKGQQNVATTVRESRELCEEGRDEVAQVLFVGVVKVKVKISHGCISGLAHDLDILEP